MTSSATWIWGRTLLGFLASAVALVAAGPDDSLTAARKFQQIAEGAYPSGTSVEVSEDEMNAFLQYHAAASIPDGVDDLELDFRDGGAIVSARVDLEEAGEASESLPFLMRLLLRGTRDITLDIEYAVSEGQANTRIVSMTIEDVQIEGEVLEWFLASFAPAELQPYLTGERSVRQQGVRETRLEPGRAVIVVD